MRLYILIYTIVFFSLLALVNDQSDNYLKIFLGTAQNKDRQIVAYDLITPTPTSTPTPIPTPQPLPTSIPKITPVSAPAKIDLPSDWGVAEKVGEHTYTMHIGADAKMATAQEILYALNSYRNAHNAGSLSWDDNLANFAKSRSDQFASQGKLDEHAGFYSYLDNKDNFKNLGFSSIGENSSIGYQIEAVHLIEWVYAGDEGHNQNQLNSKWTHVGIGVSNNATDLIFGGN